MAPRGLGVVLCSQWPRINRLRDTARTEDARGHSRRPHHPTYTSALHSLGSKQLDPFIVAMVVGR